MTTIAATHLFAFADGKSHLYSVSARWITTLPVWEGNRVLDESHVAALRASITDPTQVQGPFGVLEYTDDTSTLQRRIIDGQHRQAVLAAYFSENPTASDFPVLTRRYTGVTDHAAAIQIFQQINHAKPMVYKGSATEHLHEIVTALRRAFLVDRRGGALQMIRHGCNRPALSVENLDTAIKLYRIHERTDLTPADIVAHAQKMNEWFAEDHARIPVTVSSSMLERATEYRFFLGLDPRCSWLMELRLV
jgi:hypothetical protein